MSHIKWTKKYKIYNESGKFNIFISEHIGNQFYSSILYYDKNGSRSKDEFVDPNFKLETFIAKDEEEALGRCEEWINKNYPGEYEISAF